MTRVWSEDIRDSAIISMKVNPNQLTLLIISRRQGYLKSYFPQLATYCTSKQRKTKIDLSVLFFKLRSSRKLSLMILNQNLVLAGQQYKIQHEKYHLTASGWSPTRPSVFFTGSTNGIVDIWDLMVKQAEPILKVYLYLLSFIQ